MLCKLYLLVIYYKHNWSYFVETKDQWARDDPAFLVLLSFWLLGKFCCLSAYYCVESASQYDVNIVCTDSALKK